MERPVFERIFRSVLGEGIFVQRQDCTKKVGIDPLVRFTACMRVLAYGNCPDGYDESFEIAESTLIDSIKALTRIVIAKFGND